MMASELELPELQVAKWTWWTGFAEEAFTVDMHGAMIEDEIRTMGFQLAIERRLRRLGAGECVVVDIGTGPFAILAIFAAQAGARKVYAVEGAWQPSRTPSVPCLAGYMDTYAGRQPESHSL